MRPIAWIGYAVFLAFYAWWKYTSAAPAEFSTVYAQSTAVLVFLTGVVPFLLTWGVLKRGTPSGPLAALAGVALGALFCVAGYALYWMIFIAGNLGAPAIYTVAARGIGWGIAQGALASIAARH